MSSMPRLVLRAGAPQLASALCTSLQGVNMQPPPQAYHEAARAVMSFDATRRAPPC